MAKKCVICEEDVTKYVTDPDHPKKYVCLRCLNGIVLNSRTFDAELGPIRSALEKAFSSFNDELKKQQG
jgi:hypothetical protein